jgi:hypothetical protein
MTELACDAEREGLTREQISRKPVLLSKAAGSRQLFAPDLRVCDVNQPLEESLDERTWSAL